MRKLNQTEIETVAGGKLTEAIVRAVIKKTARRVKDFISPGPRI